MVRRAFLLIGILFFLMVASPPSSVAAARDVPLVMWSLRDRLLRDRTQLMNLRADLNQRIINLRTLQNDADKLLGSDSLSQERFEELRLARGKVLTAGNDLQRRLDIVEKALIDSNKDLANVEYYIQRYSCLR